MRPTCCLGVLSTPPRWHNRRSGTFAMKPSRLLLLCSVCIPVLRAQTLTEKVLLNFGEYPGGAGPVGTLTQDASGNLYGTAYGGGGVSQSGVVFEYSSAGKYRVLYTFLGDPTDGSGPYAGVTLDTSGNLYGTTEGGGSAGLGTVYKLSTSGQETVLHSFVGGTDGSNPYSGVTIDSAGATLTVRRITAGFRTPGSSGRLLSRDKSRSYTRSPADPTERIPTRA